MLLSYFQFVDGKIIEDSSDFILLLFTYL